MIKCRLFNGVKRDIPVVAIGRAGTRELPEEVLAKPITHHRYIFNSKRDADPVSSTQIRKA